MAERRRVVMFGEAMIRLTPPGHERIERTRSLEVTSGGAELNVAVGLTCLDGRRAGCRSCPIRRLDG